VNDRTALRAVAKIAAELSHDSRTNNAAVIATGSSFVHGMNVYLHKQWARAALYENAKLTYIEHAERLAIHTAARNGIRTEGATMYAVWAACPECARAIVGAGITRLVTLQATRDLTPERWAEPIRIADRMLAEAGVRVEFFPGRLNVQIRFNGQFVTI
jgi:deoxycytidylate deaminase